MDTMASEEQRIYNRGMSDYRDGKSNNLNNYNSPDYHIWLRGWNAAKEEDSDHKVENALRAMVMLMRTMANNSSNWTLEDNLRKALRELIR